MGGLRQQLSAFELPRHVACAATELSIDGVAETINLCDETSADSSWQMLSLPDQAPVDTTDVVQPTQAPADEKLYRRELTVVYAPPASLQPPPLATGSSRDMSSGAKASSQITTTPQTTAKAHLENSDALQPPQLSADESSYRRELTVVYAPASSLQSPSLGKASPKNMSVGAKASSQIAPLAQTTPKGSAIISKRVAQCAPSPSRAGPSRDSQATQGPAKTPLWATAFANCEGTSKASATNIQVAAQGPPVPPLSAKPQTATSNVPSPDLVAQPHTSRQASVPRLKCASPELGAQSHTPRQSSIPRSSVAQQPQSHIGIPNGQSPPVLPVCASKGSTPAPTVPPASVQQPKSQTGTPNVPSCDSLAQPHTSRQSSISRSSVVQQQQSQTGIPSASSPSAPFSGSLVLPAGATSPLPGGSLVVPSRAASVSQNEPCVSSMPPVFSYVPPQPASTCSKESSQAMPQAEVQFSYLPPKATAEHQVNYLSSKVAVEQQRSYLPPVIQQEATLSFLPPAAASSPEIQEVRMTTRQQAGGGVSLEVSAASGQSLVAPTAAAQVAVQMPATAQMPPTVRRSTQAASQQGNTQPLPTDANNTADKKVQFVESFPSFQPPAQSAVLTSPVPSWRQVLPQAPLANVGPPRLSKSHSLDNAVCPRSLVGRRGGPGYNIPAALGVEPPQWIRSRSPNAVRWVGTSPQRNRGNAAAHCNPSRGSPTDAPRTTSKSGERDSYGAFVEELLFGGPVFEPTGQAVRNQIFAKLGTKNSTIVQMKREGGMNEGMWILSGASGNYILKLVQHERRHPLMLTEAEQFVKLLKDHPAVADDPCLAFPLKIFHCRDQTRDRVVYDLVTMRKAPGGNFSDIIGRRWFLNQKAELMRDLHSLGRFLAEVHGRHNMQHGDFTPSNVFYDEASGTFTLVDMADFGQQTYGSEENDVERFTRGIKMMAKCYGDVFYSEGSRNFLAGYNERKATFS
mmetsp:Transcript_41853/g.66484  ORF Transcript_41853/g.66484 Transcript_41853/m.66484 type:complete len:970 (-) Transcript_41853:181-3090(-)